MPVSGRRSSRAVGTPLRKVERGRRKVGQAGRPPPTARRGLQDVPLLLSLKVSDAFKILFLAIYGARPRALRVRNNSRGL